MRLLGRIAPLAGLLLLGGCALLGRADEPVPPPEPPTPEIFRLSDGRQVMGTVLQITLEVTDEPSGRALLDVLFEEAMRLEAILTTWNPDSATMELNRSADGTPLPVPPELHHMLSDGRHAARETQGVFDITVAPLIELWHDAAARGALPSEAALRAAQARVGAERILLGPETALLERGMTVDFSGIGKGWTLDRLGEWLEEPFVSAALLDFGGSSWLARGAPDGETTWGVLLTSGHGKTRVVRIRDESLSVSESFGQTIRVGDRTLSHVIDPRSGWPVLHDVTAAVRAPTGARAEVWSTALLIWPPGEGVGRARRMGDLEVLVLDAVHGRFATDHFGDEAVEEPDPATPTP